MKIYIGWFLILLGIFAIFFVIISTWKSKKGDPIWAKILAVITQMIPIESAGVMIGIILILFGMFLAMKN